MSWGPFDLTGKRALVTGGAMGIGFGCAKMLFDGGASVMVADQNSEAADAAIGRAGTSPSGGVFVATRADVSDEADVNAMVQACVDQLGGIDIIVNNAGIVPFGLLVDLDPAALRRVLQVNVEGVFLCTQAAARAMIAAGTGGAVVNIASMDALHPTYAGLSAYGAAKGAVISFTKHAALELGPHGIRVNAIAPGVIWTEGGAELAKTFGVTDADRAARVEAKQPLGRDGTPTDIAAAAAFLSSGAASFITGETLLADGGTLLT